jgi:hypothetical protein
MLSLENIVLDSTFPLLLIFYYSQIKSHESFEKAVLNSVTVASITFSVVAICTRFFLPPTDENAFTFGNVNMFSEFLLFLIPLTLYRLRNSNLLILISVIIIQLTAIFLLRSRSVLFGSLFIVEFFIFQKIYLITHNWKNYFTKFSTYFVLLIPNILIGASFLNKLTNEKVGSNSHRQELLKLSNMLIKDQLSKGVGIGQFEFSLAPYYGYPNTFLDRTPHSEFLKWIAENSMPIMLIAVFILAFFIFKSVSRLSSQQIKFSNLIRLDSKFVMFLAFNFSLLIQCAVQFPFENPASLLLIATSEAFFLIDFLDWDSSISINKYFKYFSSLVLTGLSVILFFSQWVYSYSNDPKLSKTACQMEFIQWRNCQTVIHRLIETGSWEEVEEVAKLDLKQRPFNYFSLLFFSQSLLNSSKIDSACTAGSLYYQLFPNEPASKEILKICTEYENALLDHSFHDKIKMSDLFSSKFDSKKYLNKLSILLR